MNAKYRPTENQKVKKREANLQKFYERILDQEEIPCIVTDRATIFDISTLDDAELLTRIKINYGITLAQNDLSLPLWKLIDILSANSNQSN